MRAHDLDDALSATPDVAARALLGCRLTASAPEGEVSVVLTETEAYAGTADPASHAYRGRTVRTQVMFGPAGFLYVYRSHGLHWCCNVSTGPEGVASAVLLRAGRVVDGVELARERRGAAVTDVRPARGPGNLARALGLRFWTAGDPTVTPYRRSPRAPRPA
jgi:DNA-3-methyladenine glycosylase